MRIPFVLGHVKDGTTSTYKVSEDVGQNTEKGRLFGGVTDAKWAGLFDGYSLGIGDVL